MDAFGFVLIFSQYGDGLHVIDAILDRDLGEGDAGGRGFAGREHSGEVQRCVTILKVELVHGGRQLGAVPGVDKELGLMLVFGDEAAHGDTDKKRAVEFRVLRALRPE